MVTVAEFVADFLYKKGITDIFMISGGGAIYLDNAVAQHPGLREICIKNEATGPMMAKAYGQIKNNFGVVYVTTGPGGANAITGVVECFVDSLPVLVISGQAPAAQTTHLAGIPGLRSFGVQELNIIDLVKPITKYAEMVTQEEDILLILEKAIYTMKSDRPGPVWVDIPLDIQSAEIDPTKLIGYEPIPRSNFSRTKAESTWIIEDLKNALRPLIVAGQGARNSVEELKELAEHLDAPIIFSRMGLDVLPLSYKYNMGIGGIKGQKYSKEIMQHADVVIAVGTSLSVAFAGYDLSFFNKNAKIYMIDIEEAESMKFHRKLRGFFRGDAKSYLTFLIYKLRQEGPAWHDTLWMSRCMADKNLLHASKLAKEQNPIDIYYLTKKIDDISNENDVFVDDAGSIYYVAAQTLTFNKGQREITSGAYASMGNTIPLSIGCAIANPKLRVLAMTGDGSLETNIQELKTLSHYKLNVKLFVINNGGYISMRDHGRNNTDECDCMLNLKKVADAYDMPYYLIKDYNELDTYLPTFINERGPAFIEVTCDDKQKLIIPT